MIVIFRKAEVVSSPSSHERTKTSRNGSAPSFSSSIVNSISVNVAFKWVLKSACLTLLIIAKVSSMHLTQNDGFLVSKAAASSF